MIIGMLSKQFFGEDKELNFEQNLKVNKFNI